MATGDHLDRQNPESTVAVSGGIGAQARQQFLLAADGQFHGTTCSTAQPSRLGEVLVDLVCQLARQVIAAFGPIQAAVSESASSTRRTRNHPQFLEPISSRSGKFVPVGRRCQAFISLKRIKHRDRELPRQVPVAASCKAHAFALRMAPRAVVLIALGNQRQGFQSMRHVDISQPVVPVTAPGLADNESSIQELA